MRPSKREEIVRKALQIFYRDGFQATGMDRLVAETGISKTSMYNHFPTKDALIVATLELRDQEFRDWLFGRMTALADDPAGQLLAMFDALDEWFDTPEFRGCMFVNAAAEFADPGHPAVRQAVAHKQALLQYLAQLAGAAQASSPSVLAADLVLLKEGAIVSAQLNITKDPADRARAMADARIAQACRP